MATKVKIKNSTISDSDLNTLVDSGNEEVKSGNKFSLFSGNSKVKDKSDNSVNTDIAFEDNSRKRMKNSTDLAQNEKSLMDNYGSA